MLPRTAIVAALLVAATAPLTATAAGNCYDDPQREELFAGVGALGQTFYIALVDVDDGSTSTLGLWREANDAQGLQTTTCEIGGHVYRAPDSRVSTFLQL